MVRLSTLRRLAASEHMAGLRKIALNFHWLTLSTGATAISTMAVSALLARKMGTWSFGQWALIASTASWITVVRGGVGQHLARLSASNPQLARTLLYPSWFLMVILSAILGFAGVRLNVKLQSPLFVTASVLAVGGTFLTAVFGMVISVFAGRDQMHWNLADGAQSLAVLIGVAVVPSRILNPQTVAAIYFATSLIVAIPVVAGGFRRIRPALPPAPAKVAFNLISENIWLIGIQLLAILHLSVDLYLLQFFRDSGQVGVFSAALKIIIAIRLLPWLLMMSVIPRLSRGLPHDNALASRVWSVVLHTLLPIEGILVVLLVCAPRLILSALYSRSFDGAGPALALLGASLIPHCLWQVLGASVMAKGHYRGHFSSSLFCGLVHTLFSVLLIRRHGVLGASGAFIIGECAALLSIAVVAFRTLGHFPFAQVRRFALCLAASVALGFVTMRFGWIPVAGCAAALACYMALLVSTGIVSRDSLGRAFRPAQ
jgi:O-antigen/teichoic acid export membrane protein